MKFTGVLILALLLPALAFADPPLALECRGTGSAKQRDLRFAVTLTGLAGNSVVVEDIERMEACNCKFRHGNFFDQDRGPMRIYTVHLKFESCEASCSRDLKRRMNASIDVRHRLDSGVQRSYATPFVGDEIANCDRFSIDLPAIRRLEIERIDAMDETPRFKRLLKALKGLEAS